MNIIGISVLTSFDSFIKLNGIPIDIVIVDTVVIGLLNLNHPLLANVGFHAAANPDVVYRVCPTVGVEPAAGG